MNPKQGLYDTALTAEAEYSINFTEQGNNSFLSLHTLQWKQQLFIGQWSKILWIQCRKFRFICIFTFFKKYFKRGFSCKYEKKTGLYEYVYDFSYCFGISVNNTLDVHKYFMKYHDTEWCLDLFKKCLLNY